MSGDGTGELARIGRRLPETVLVGGAGALAGTVGIAGYRTLRARRRDGG